ncbi:unnamed protein product [Amoebophrya sp. A25]|nr:unnamed protein product [Amoebophrya sp. A25]|eukprot:GSA25T00016997001.1
MRSSSVEKSLAERNSYPWGMNLGGSPISRSASPSTDARSVVAPRGAREEREDRRDDGAASGVKDESANSNTVNEEQMNDDDIQPRPSDGGFSARLEAASRAIRFAREAEEEAERKLRAEIQQAEEREDRLMRSARSDEIEERSVYYSTSGTVTGAGTSGSGVLGVDGEGDLGDLQISERDVDEMLNLSTSSSFILSAARNRKEEEFREIALPDKNYTIQMYGGNINGKGGNQERKVAAKVKDYRDASRGTLFHAPTLKNSAISRGSPSPRGIMSNSGGAISREASLNIPRRVSFAADGSGTIVEKPRASSLTPRTPLTVAGVDKQKLVGVGLGLKSPPPKPVTVTQETAVEQATQQKIEDVDHVAAARFVRQQEQFLQSAYARGTRDPFFDGFTPKIDVSNAIAQVKSIAQVKGPTLLREPSPIGGLSAVALSPRGITPRKLPIPAHLRGVTTGERNEVAVGASGSDQGRGGQILSHSSTPRGTPAKVLLLPPDWRSRSLTPSRDARKMERERQQMGTAQNRASSSFSGIPSPRQVSGPPGAIKFSSGLQLTTSKNPLSSSAVTPRNIKNPRRDVSPRGLLATGAASGGAPTVAPLDEDLETFDEISALLDRKLAASCGKTFAKVDSLATAAKAAAAPLAKAHEKPLVVPLVAGSGEAPLAAQAQVNRSGSGQHLGKNSSHRHPAALKSFEFDVAFSSIKKTSVSTTLKEHLLRSCARALTPVTLPALQEENAVNLHDLLSSEVTPRPRGDEDEVLQDADFEGDNVAEASATEISVRDTDAAQAHIIDVENQRQAATSSFYPLGGRSPRGPPTSVNLTSRLEHLKVAKDVIGGIHLSAIPSAPIKTIDKPTPGKKILDDPVVKIPKPAHDGGHLSRALLSPRLISASLATSSSKDTFYNARTKKDEEDLPSDHEMTKLHSALNVAGRDARHSRWTRRTSRDTTTTSKTREYSPATSLSPPARPPSAAFDKAIVVVNETGSNEDLSCGKSPLPLVKSLPASPKRASTRAPLFGQQNLDLPPSSIALAVRGSPFLSPRTAFLPPPRTLNTARTSLVNPLQSGAAEQSLDPTRASAPSLQPLVAPLSARKAMLSPTALQTTEEAASPAAKKLQPATLAGVQIGGFLPSQAAVRETTTTVKDEQPQGNKKKSNNKKKTKLNQAVVLENVTKPEDNDALLKHYTKSALCCSSLGEMVRQISELQESVLYWKSKFRHDRDADVLAVLEADHHSLVAEVFKLWAGVHSSSASAHKLHLAEKMHANHKREQEQLRRDRKAMYEHEEAELLAVYEDAQKEMKTLLGQQEVAIQNVQKEIAEAKEHEEVVGALTRDVITLLVRAIETELEVDREGKQQQELQQRRTRVLDEVDAEQDEHYFDDHDGEHAQQQQVRIVPVDPELQRPREPRVVEPEELSYVSSSPPGSTGSPAWEDEETAMIFQAQVRDAHGEINDMLNDISRNLQSQASRVSAMTALDEDEYEQQYGFRPILKLRELGIPGGKASRASHVSAEGEATEDEEHRKAAASIFENFEDFRAASRVASGSEQGERRSRQADREPLTNRTFTAILSETREEEEKESSIRSVANVIEDPPVIEQDQQPGEQENNNNKQQKEHDDVGASSGASSATASEGGTRRRRIASVLLERKSVSFNVVDVVVGSTVHQDKNAVQKESFTSTTRRGQVEGSSTSFSSSKDQGSFFRRYIASLHLSPRHHYVVGATTAAAGAGSQEPRRYFSAPSSPRRGLGQHDAGDGLVQQEADKNRIHNPTLAGASAFASHPTRVPVFEDVEVLVAPPASPGMSTRSVTVEKRSRSGSPIVVRDTTTWTFPFLPPLPALKHANGVIGSAGTPNFLKSNAPDVGTVASSPLSSSSLRSPVISVSSPRNDLILQPRVVSATTSTSSTRYADAREVGVRKANNNNEVEAIVKRGESSRRRSSRGSGRSGTSSSSVHQPRPPRRLSRHSQTVVQEMRTLLDEKLPSSRIPILDPFDASRLRMVQMQNNTTTPTQISKMNSNLNLNLNLLTQSVRIMPVEVGKTTLTPGSGSVASRSPRSRSLSPSIISSPDDIAVALVEDPQEEDSTSMPMPERIVPQAVFEVVGNNAIATDLPNAVLDEIKDHRAFCLGVDFTTSTTGRREDGSDRADVNPVRSVQPLIGPRLCNPGMGSSLEYENEKWQLQQEIRHNNAGAGVGVVSGIFASSSSRAAPGNNTVTPRGTGVQLVQSARGFSSSRSGLTMGVGSPSRLQGGPAVLCPFGNSPTFRASSTSGLDFKLGGVVQKNNAPPPFEVKVAPGPGAGASRQLFPSSTTNLLKNVAVGTSTPRQILQPSSLTSPKTAQQSFFASAGGLQDRSLLLPGARTAAAVASNPARSSVKRQAQIRPSLSLARLPDTSASSSATNLVLFDKQAGSFLGPVAGLHQDTPTPNKNLNNATAAASATSVSSLLSPVTGQIPSLESPPFQTFAELRPFASVEYDIRHYIESEFTEREQQQQT